MNPTPLWADIATIAKLFSLSATSIRQHVTAGILPPGVMVGGRRLWKVADVDAALSRLKDDAGSVSPIRVLVMEVINARVR